MGNTLYSEYLKTIEIIKDILLEVDMEPDEPDDSLVPPEDSCKTPDGSKT